MHGKTVPDSYFAGKRFSTMTGNPTGKVMLAPVEPFHQPRPVGSVGYDFLPYTAGIVDDYLRQEYHRCRESCGGDFRCCFSGAVQEDKPTLGAWLAYGHNGDRAAARVCHHDERQQQDKLQTGNLLTLLGMFAVAFHESEVSWRRRSLLYLRSRRHVANDATRLMTTSPRQSAQARRLGIPRSPGLPNMSRVQSTSQRAELTEFCSEPKSVLELYGPQVREPGTFSHNCLCSRRLIERGVRCPGDAAPGGTSTTKTDHRALHPVQGYRPAFRRTRPRPQAARLARRHTRHLGRRVRPHAFIRVTSTIASGRDAITTLMPSRHGWPAAASSRGSATARPTTSP